MLQLKTAIVALLLLFSGTAAGTTLYYQLRLDDANGQISELDSRITGLNQEIQKLQTNITDLSQRLIQSRVNSSLVSNATLYLVGAAPALYVPFFVSSISEKLNVSFTATSSNPSDEIITALMDQQQYDAFRVCNCVYYGNYTETTWMSPQATSYQTTLPFPHVGNWYFAFMEPPGTGNERYVRETIILYQQ